MPNDAHLPNLEFAGEWLDDAIAAMRCHARGDIALTPDQFETLANTLDDIRARAVIVPRDVAGVALIACRIVGHSDHPAASESAICATLALDRLIGAD